MVQVMGGGLMSMSMGMHAYGRYWQTWLHGCMGVCSWSIRDINSYAHVHCAGRAHVQASTTIIPIGACVIDSQNKHDSTKSQNYQGITFY
jgi:hypothetical protein